VQQTDVLFVTLIRKLTLMNKCGVQYLGRLLHQNGSIWIHNGFTYLLANRKCEEMDSSLSAVISK
jgi:hypothetical protein